jgi:hypothetical protein
VLHNAKINDFFQLFSHDKNLFPMKADGKKKKKQKNWGIFRK